MLRIEGMNTHYGASHVLQGVDLDMPQGRISAVLGRNGVGKTTMVKTIMGLVSLSGGRVAVGDLSGTRLWQLGRRPSLWLHRRDCASFRLGG